MLDYLELAQLMQYGLHHPEGFVIVSTPAPNLIHSQAHEVVMDAHQQHVQVQLLHVNPDLWYQQAANSVQMQAKLAVCCLCSEGHCYLLQPVFAGPHGSNLKLVYGSQT